MNTKFDVNENEKIHVFSLDQEDVKPHMHNYLEFVYITKGKGIHDLNGVKTVVKKGDYFIIDYNNIHSYNRIGGAEFMLVNCLFVPSFIDRALKNCKSFNEVISNYQIHFRNKSYTVNPTSYVFYDNGEILPLVNKLVTEYENKPAGYFELMRCVLKEILILMMRNISREGSAKKFDACIEQVLDYTDKNYSENISLSKLSAELNYSLPYISAKFKDNVGMTFCEYLQRLRINQSCKLLADTDKKIIEVAELVGYRDIRFFNTLFKKYIGSAPGQFRKFNKMGEL